MYDIHTRTRTSASSVTPLQNARGTGTTFVNLSGASVRAVRLPCLTRSFCEFCFHSRTRNFCEFYTTFIPTPGPSVSSVPPWLNTRVTGRRFQKYPGAGTGTGATSVYIPGTSMSSVRLPYPYPSTLSTENILDNSVEWFRFNDWSKVSVPSSHLESSLSWLWVSSAPHKSSFPHASCPALVYGGGRMSTCRRTVVIEGGDYLFSGFREMNFEIHASTNNEYSSHTKRYDAVCE